MNASLPSAANLVWKLLKLRAQARRSYGIDGGGSRCYRTGAREVLQRPMRLFGALASSVAVPTRVWSIRDVLSSTFGTSTGRKRAKWNQRVIEAFRELESRFPGMEALTNSPTFNKVVSEAELIALKSRDEEKLRVLLNAVLNSALPNAPSSTVQVFFLRFVDELTPAHLQVLAMLNGPREWLRRRSIPEDKFNLNTVDFLIQTCLSVLEVRADSCGPIVRALHSRGLIQQYKADAIMTCDNLLAPRTTAIGRQFLTYISKPWL